MNTLLLDSGNFIAARPLGEAAIEPSTGKAGVLLEAMELMGYAAVAVGEKDLYLGLERLRSLASLTKVTFLSANLMDDNGSTIFEPHRLIRVGGITVGVIGLTASPADGRLFARRAPGARVDDPLEAARKAANELREKCGLLVILSNIGYGKDLELADAIPEIDIIISGGTKRFMRQAVKRNKTLITSGYFEGRAIGKLVVHLKGKVAGWFPSRELDLMDKRIKDAEGKVGTPAGKRHHDELLGKRKAAEDLTLYETDMVNLDPSIPDDRQVADMIREYRKGLKENTKTGEVSSTGTDQLRYVGAKACATCHRSRYRYWLATDHSRAFASLAPKDAEADTDCVPCHVTGYMRRTGYWPRAPREDLRDVQCEVCHGVGSLHVNDPDRYSLLHLPSAPQCMDCHTEEQDDDFDYFRDRKEICAEAD